MDHGSPTRDVSAKRGMEFIHAKWLDGDNAPLRCRVTAVRSGVVYWKAIYADGTLGQGMWCDLSEFAASVKKVLSLGDRSPLQDQVTEENKRMDSRVS